MQLPGGQYLTVEELHWHRLVRGATWLQFAGSVAVVVSLFAFGSVVSNGDLTTPTCPQGITAAKPVSFTAETMDTFLAAEKVVSICQDELRALYLPRWVIPLFLMGALIAPTSVAFSFIAQQIGKRRNTLSLHTEHVIQVQVIALIVATLVLLALFSVVAYLLGT